MTQPYVISVILNYNRPQDTMEYLASMAQTTYQNHHVILLDSGSSAESKEIIHSTFPAVQIIELVENLGYAGNNNVGIKAALAQGADWVFVLNEDTVLAPDCLACLVEAGESDPQIGIVGPMVYHHDEPTLIQSAGGKLGRYWESTHLAQNEPDHGQFNQPHHVDWLSGCGIMVRRAAIKQIGTIDERYFCYWEETDWCVRAGKAGWQIMHVPAAKLWHKGVQRDYHPKPSVTYYTTRNRLLTLAKHHAPPTVWVRVWAQHLRTLISWTVKPKWRSKREHRNALWHGMVDFLRHRSGQMPQ